MPRRILLPLVLALLLTAPVVHAASSAFPPVKSNPADRFKSPVDEPRYDHAKHCVKHPTRGALALQGWLEENWRGESWGIMRCAKLSKQNYSLHAEGRALDWHLDIHDSGDHRAAVALVRLLLASDRAGNENALARRMGVQELIWDCRIWWPGLEQMAKYSECYGRDGKPRKVDESNAHRNHVHVGLNKDGAAMRTSFWRR